MTILHVFPDEKFFDSSSNGFDRLMGVQNLYYLYKPEKNYKFKFIKNTNKVKIINDKQEYLNLFSSANIDIILFHSLRISHLEYFKYLDKKKVVVWWSWGGDIYNTIYNDVKPLIHWDLYKPITSEYMKEHCSKPKKTRLHLKQRIKHIKHKYTLWRIIRRVDLFIPCMSYDYKLLIKNCRYFRADYLPLPQAKVTFKFTHHNTPSNVLIGNSLTYTNNHLDIFEKIFDYKLADNRKFIIPVSYGWGNAFNNNPEILISISKLDPDKTVWLKEYIENHKYFELFSSVSHAIFGVLRQQALANIYRCLLKGIKLYLYKDSIVANQLKEDGFIFYTIDDDLTEESLSECLSYDDALHNYNLIMNNYYGESMSYVEKKLNEIISLKDNV